MMPPRGSGPGQPRGMIYSDEIRDLLNQVLEQQSRLLEKQQQLEVALAKVQTQMQSIVTREEIQSLLEQRVPAAVYHVEHEALKNRVGDLETRLDKQPGTAWNRVFMAVTMLVATAAAIIALITLLRG
jgi:predicted nuclease with TOPRIM domain